ncbi:alpha/beta fold hydrolase [Synechococcus sp. BIOS-E4-1]|uniref:alpha/beta fold hydrolase n=1 Tax=Synechococcus sp. BIOS-E4-1 TaxID=1400864 RepID=UPI0016490A4E|nr:alpha/beta fold hydrolase [Synechococcus sp. BIOS-E4-1]
MDNTLTCGPLTGPATVLLAHGAGAGIDTPFMQKMAQGLAQKGWQVIRFEFPYMTQRRISGRKAPPNRADVLLKYYVDQVQSLDANQPLIIGGKSMGGRIASLVADELWSGNRILGCICLGYPFHPLGKPETLRVKHLQNLQTPTLVVQGERDAMGSKEEVKNYALSERLKLAWMPDGDHSFKPRIRSGRREGQNFDLAVEHMHDFLRGLMNLE